MQNVKLLWYFHSFKKPKGISKYQFLKKSLIKGLESSITMKWNIKVVVKNVFYSLALYKLGFNYPTLNTVKSVFTGCVWSQIFVGFCPAYADFSLFQFIFKDYRWQPWVAIMYQWWLYSLRSL